jgi:opacity protein-like surface antigen
MNKMFSVVVASVFCVTGHSYCSEVISPELPPFMLSLAPTDAETTGEVTTRNGWYITPNVGLNILSGISIKGEISGKVKVDFKDGTSFGASVGHRISDVVKVQFDFSHYKNDVERGTGTVNGDDYILTGGEIEQFSIMTTVMWQGDSGNVQPYFGVGAGAIRSEMDYTYTYPVAAPGISFDYSNNEWALALQILAGASIKLSPTSELLLNYRFLHAEYEDDGDIDNHTFGIGVQISF